MEGPDKEGGSLGEQAVPDEGQFTNGFDHETMKILGLNHVNSPAWRRAPSWPELISSGRQAGGAGTS